MKNRFAILPGNRRLQSAIAVFCVLSVTGCVPKTATSPYLGYQTKTDLLFPLTGIALITNGGRSGRTNNHVKSRDQRFAIDAVSLPEHKFKDGNYSAWKTQSFSGDRTKNSSYHCFGQLVVAPGDGVVHATRNRIEDNKNVRNLKNSVVAGNYVVIDHENGEYSMLAHFKHRTVKVKRGDRVKQGQPLGECGNSGRSSEPHLHYHLQNSPFWFQGYGLPIQFRRYLNKGKPLVNAEPRRGDIISRE